MRSPAAPAPINSAIATAKPRYLWLRVTCWTVALGLGAAQAWFSRFAINPDGIAYLDLGDAYWRGDWDHAINALWSPMYSWIQGLFGVLVQPSMIWKYPLAHFVNFLCYAFALVCFEFLLRTLIAEGKEPSGQNLDMALSGLSTWVWYVICYPVFLLISLVFIGLQLVTPDICLAGFFFLAVALTLRGSRRDASYRLFVTLGLVLGLAYLTRTIMFLLSFAFFALLLLQTRVNRNVWRKVAACIGVFMVVSLPFVSALSGQKRRLTFGDVGAWNYAFYVNGASYWVYSEKPKTYAAGEPESIPPGITRASVLPAIYVFHNRSWTYPPWDDPTSLSDRVSPKFTISGHLMRLRVAFIVYLGMLLLTLAPLYLTAVALCWGDPNSKWRVSFTGTGIISVCAVNLVLYSLIHVEWRYVAAPCAVLVLILCSGFVFRSDRVLSRAPILATIVIALTITIGTAFVSLRQSVRASLPDYCEAAVVLRNKGVSPADPVGLIWREKWNDGAVEGAYLPRLLSARVVAEAPDADSFWQLSPKLQGQALAVFKDVGVKVVLARDVPEPEQLRWTRLGTTKYFAYFIGNSR